MSYNGTIGQHTQPALREDGSWVISVFLPEFNAWFEAVCLTQYGIYTGLVYVGSSWLTFTVEIKESTLPPLPPILPALSPIQWIGLIALAYVIWKVLKR